MNLCPVCKGKCCRDSYRYKLTHMGDEFYEHVCEACEDGTKYIAPPTYEDGIAEGERRERSAVVAYLRATAHAPHPVEADTPMLSPSGSGLLLLEAARIERGAHRDHREEGPT